MHSEHLAHSCDSHAPGLGNAGGIPSSIEQLRERQNNARRDFESALERVIDALAEMNPIKPTASLSNTLGGAALARASRRVEQDTKERRYLAQMLLTAALLNHGNPDWDPADASTDRANHDDPFVALLQMDLTAQG
jgi:hypothetical protein